MFPFKSLRVSGVDLETSRTQRRKTGTEASSSGRSHIEGVLTDGVLRFRLEPKSQKTTRAQPVKVVFGSDSFVAFVSRFALLLPALIG